MKNKPTHYPYFGQIRTKPVVWFTRNNLWKMLKPIKYFGQKPKNSFFIFINKLCQRFDNICVKKLSYTGLLCLNSCKHIKKEVWRFWIQIWMIKTKKNLPVVMKLKINGYPTARILFSLSIFFFILNIGYNYFGVLNVMPVSITVCFT